jgi:hypothetical protein
MLLAAIAATVTIAACSEHLESGSSCPLLCPEQSLELRDTIIPGVIFDSTVIGLPPIGAESFLMLASHGDSLETRVIVRFDTLPQTFTAANSVDSTITHIDSATLITPILKPDVAHRPSGPITIEVYDVDSMPPDSVTIPTDTVSSVLATLFRPNRLIGSKTFAPESLLDTLRIPISTDTVLDRVTHGTKLRVGFRLVSSEGYDLQIGSTQISLPVTLQIKASLDSNATPVNLTPLSATPTNETFLSGPLADYSIVLKGGSTLQRRDVIGVGGVPARRTLLRFDVPSFIVDSTTIVRATLILTQTPNRFLDLQDSVYVFPSPVLATSSVFDVRSLLQFVGFAGQFGLDSLKLAPGDSGQREFQIVNVVRTWHGTTAQIAPRALALRSRGEGGAPAEIDFFSAEAPDALRPRLRITYAPQTRFGLP